MVVWSVHALWKIRRDVVILALDTRPCTYWYLSNTCWISAWMNTVLHLSISVHAVTIKAPPFKKRSFSYINASLQGISHPTLPPKSFLTAMICKSNLLGSILTFKILSFSLIVFLCLLFSITRLNICTLKCKILAMCPCTVSSSIMEVT